MDELTDDQLEEYVKSIAHLIDPALDYCASALEDAPTADLPDSYS